MMMDFTPAGIIQRVQEEAEFLADHDTISLTGLGAKPYEELGRMVVRQISEDTISVLVTPDGSAYPLEQTYDTDIEDFAISVEDLTTSLIDQLIDQGTITVRTRADNLGHEPLDRERDNARRLVVRALADAASDQGWPQIVDEQADRLIPLDRAAYRRWKGRA